MRIFIPYLLLICFSSTISYSQTIISSGNWDNTGIWSGGNIGNAINENISFNNNLGTITIRSGFNYQVGEIQMNQGNTLEVESGASLDVGSATQRRNFLVGNSATVIVNGDLEIWGDLNVGNSLTLIVSGTFIVHNGNVNIGNSGTLDISGDVTIEGDFNGSNGVNLNVDGNLSVENNMNVGNNSSVSGSGSITVGGFCNDGNSDFCGTGPFNNSPLPVTLLGLDVKAKSGTAIIQWQTATETNNDYFTIERSKDGLHYHSIGTVEGAGTTKQIQSYQFTDAHPFAGTSYYRLTQTDFDGSSETFRPVSVFNEVLTESLALHPNPTVDNKVTLTSANLNQGENAEITIYNLFGQNVYKHRIYVEERGYFELSLPDLPAGNYILSLKGNRHLHSSKLLVK